MRDKIVVFSILLLSNSIAALASIDDPIIRMLEGPATYPPKYSWISAIVILIIVLALALIQSLVARRYLKDIPFRRLMLIFAVLVLLTPQGPSHYGPIDFWSTLLPGFAIAVIVQSLLILIFEPFGALSKRDYYKVSAMVGIVGFGALTAVTASMVYVPTMLNEDRTILKGLSGNVLVTLDWHEAYKAAMDNRNFEKISIGVGDPGGDPPKLLGSMMTIGQYGPCKLELYQWDASEDTLDLPKEVHKASAISPDGRLIVGDVAGVLVIYDVGSRKVLRKLPNELRSSRGKFSNDNRFLAMAGEHFSIWLVDIGTGKSTKIGTGSSICFSQREARLAWVENSSYLQASDGFLIEKNAKSRIAIYDCKRGIRQSIAIPDKHYSGLAWSPDGRYFAYLGFGLNPYTNHLRYPYLRVISLDGKRSASVCWTDIDYDSYQLDWLP